ncbi:MAG: homocysteine S-methyltransferase family protein [Desulfopila sp.]
MDAQSIIDGAPLILTEGAVSGRLQHAPGVKLHPTLFNTPLIYHDKEARHMKAIYKQYRDIAMSAHLPFLFCAPTWRVDRDRLSNAGFDASLLRDAISFARSMQDEWQHPDSPVIAGGLIGPQNDCYRADQALSSDDSAAYHAWQINELVTTGLDCIVAQTIPAVSEAMGMALLLGRTETPYIISFVIDKKGVILDGTPLMDGIAAIDSQIERPPLGYMVNCVYPSFINAEKQQSALFRRLIGIQANSSSRDHTELDGATIIHQDDLHHWGTTMLELHHRYGIKILGGCCGTDDTYLRYLVEHMAQ